MDFSSAGASDEGLMLRATSIACHLIRVNEFISLNMGILTMGPKTIVQIYATKKNTVLGTLQAVCKITLGIAAQSIKGEAIALQCT